ncbi:hypothetical protein KDN24_05535 [Bacillus sp. Bva_UNVM-123]|uniref:hypothetical protein n=1 Tax=Bacillus sp. Bva_UNVM-123 TaxID=2829798 RepID=UPI00391F4B58
MKKKATMLLLVLFLLVGMVKPTFASGSLGSVSENRNYNRLYQEIEIYFSPQADRVTVQLDKRDFGGKLESPMMFGGKPNSFMKFRFYCAADVIFSWYRIGASTHENVQTIRITPQFINNCMCETATNTNYPTFQQGIQFLPQTNFDWHYPSGFASCGYDGSQDKDTGGSGGDGGDGSGGNGSGGDGGGGSGGNGSGGGGNGSGGDGSGGSGGGSGSNGKVSFGWNHVKNPSKGTPKSYKVIRNGQVIDTIPGSSNSYTDSTAKVGEKYDYEVIPVYEDGTEGDSIEIGNVEVKDDKEIVIRDGKVVEKCDPCKIFECPGWQQYMGKLDQIKDSIPPTPNWPEVADTFRDSIVPKLVDDVGNLLGKAPEPPAPPPQLPGLDDRGIKSHEPEMKDVPGLKEAGFDANKIKNQAPVISERDDPTGGFDLVKNPMDTLPDAPENPKPGETDAGEWGQNKPKEEANPFPFPKDKGEPNVGTPPKPSDNGAKPPTPGGDPGSAPKPGGDLGNGPSPGGTEGDSGMKDYKPNPNAPDGSGRDIWP